MLNLDANQGAGDGGMSRHVKLKVNPTKKSGGVKRTNPGLINLSGGDGKFGWRLTLLMGALSCMVLSWISVFQMVKFFELEQIWMLAAFPLTLTTEGPVFSWYFAPLHGSVSKSQKDILGSGAMGIIVLQVFEFIFSVAATATGNKGFFVMAAACMIIMIAVALIISKLVEDEDEIRVTQMERADARIQNVKYDVRIEKMEARQILDNKRAIIQAEDEARAQDMKNVLAALKSERSKAEIARISQVRASAVIRLLLARTQAYLDDIGFAPQILEKHLKEEDAKQIGKAQKKL